MRTEIRDARAYNVVYRENSLSNIYRKWSSKPSTIPHTGADSNRQNTSCDTEDNNSNNFIVSAETQRRPTKSAVVNFRDPFHVKSCMLDVELNDSRGVSFPKLDSVDSKSTPTTRKKLRRVKTAPIRKVGQESLLPGNCTSYYSIRRYYEQEKDKVLNKWSPQEQRKRTVRYILDDMKQRKQMETSAAIYTTPSQSTTDRSSANSYDTRLIK